jgi:hypothetical protein
MKKNINITFREAMTDFGQIQVTVIEKEVEDLVDRKEKDLEIVESLLDIVLALMELGVGEELFIRLYSYYVGLHFV